MFKKVYNAVKEFIMEEYKFLLFAVLFYIVCTWPVNYYIVVGGGISDVSSRIAVEDGFDSSGSFNLSYVSELKGCVLTYGLSYIIPSWDRESMDDYKYSENDKYEDIEFRGELDLKSANASAVKTAYSLAGKRYRETSSKIYVIATFNEYQTEFQIRDELVSVDGIIYESVEEYSSYIQKFGAGDEVDVVVRRGNKERKLKCKIYEEKDRKIFGVGLQIVKGYDVDPEVNINFNASESGPSGGLVTTLEIYNQLVEEDITNSLKVAGTGTVDGNGNVGPVGGVKYKVIGAVAGKADVFLVPAGKNYEEAMKVKEEKKLDIKVISVTSVDDAIRKLAAI